MTGKDALPWLIIVTLGATALAVNSAPQNLGPLKSALAACATPVSASPILKTPKAQYSSLRKKILSLRQPLKKLKLNSTQLPKAKSFIGKTSTSKYSVNDRLESLLIKKIEYDWQHWVELDPGVYVYGGAQFTLRNRARVRMSDGVINVVEL